jgi:hypothetical protein
MNKPFGILILFLMTVSLHAQNQVVVYNGGVPTTAAPVGTDAGLATAATIATAAGTAVCSTANGGVTTTGCSAFAGPTFASPHTFWTPFPNNLISLAGSATTQGANLPQLWSFNLPYPAKVTTILAFVIAGTGAATCDIGIYGPVASGNTTASLAVHTGSFACATNTAYVSQAATSATTLQPGFYYQATCASAGTVTFGGLGAVGTYNTVPATLHLDGQDSTGADNCTAGVLPASITIANIGGTQSTIAGIYITN